MSDLIPSITIVRMPYGAGPRFLMESSSSDVQIASRLQLRQHEDDKARKGKRGGVERKARRKDAHPPSVKCCHT